MIKVEDHREWLTIECSELNHFTKRGKFSFRHFLDCGHFDTACGIKHPEFSFREGKWSCRNASD